jgi:hypothetical protein
MAETLRARTDLIALIGLPDSALMPAHLMTSGRSGDDRQDHLLKGTYGRPARQKLAQRLPPTGLVRRRGD